MANQAVAWDYVQNAIAERPARKTYDFTLALFTKRDRSAINELHAPAFDDWDFLCLAHVFHLFAMYLVFSAPFVYCITIMLNCQSGLATFGATLL